MVLPGRGALLALEVTGAGAGHVATAPPDGRPGHGPRVAGGKEGTRLLAVPRRLHPDEGHIVAVVVQAGGEAGCCFVVQEKG